MKTTYKKDYNEITFDELDTLTVEELGKRSNDCYGFFDWFCDQMSLPRRANRLLKVLRTVTKANKSRFVPEKCYVFFKNNCPLIGRTYDDFRICDKETGKVLINVCPTRHEIWSFVNDFKKPFYFNNMKELKTWFAKS